MVCFSTAQYLNCGTMPHGSTLPHTDCYRFYHCYNGLVSILICPEYYKFNQNSGRCEYSPDCNQGSSPPISSENPCVNEKTGTNKPHGTTCKFYYYCSAGLAVLMSCPDGWGFNASEELCVKGLNCV